MKKIYEKPTLDVMSLEMNQCCAVSEYQTLPAINEAQADVSGDVKNSGDWDIWSCQE